MIHIRFRNKGKVMRKLVISRSGIHMVCRGTKKELKEAGI